ncbi:MAG: transposase, partial [Anaerolineae bacterium]
MTHQFQLTLPADLLETIADQGLDALPELVRVLVNETMRIERQNYLAAAPYQRTAERRGHANGFKPKTVATRLGDIEFAIPQVRESGFYPQALEKGLRSERALNLALA